MNTIVYENVYKTAESDKNFMHLHEWREVDHQKIEKTVHEIFNKIKLIDPEYKVLIEKKSNISPYLGDFITYQDEYYIYQEYKNFSREFSFFVPKLIQKNYYTLNNALYVPILMLEKAPIDRVMSEPDAKVIKNKIYANLNPMYNFTFDFHVANKSKKKIERIVFFNYKKIELDLFLRVIFKDDEDKLEELYQNGLIHTKETTLGDKRKFVKFLGFHKESFFDDIDLVKWIDTFLILDFYHELFEDFYGFRGIKNIVWKIIELFLTGEKIDMSDIHNRRIIHSEYLIKPIFESYLRLLYGVIDKNGQNFLITMNQKVIMTSGFTNNLHRGNLYDISIPYALPLINKVSQDISVINDGRLPKSWQRNDSSAQGILCPISVSAANVGANVVFTTQTLVNEYGRLKLKNL